MAKAYRIKVILDQSQVEAASRRSVDNAARVAAASEKAADRQQKAAERAAAAAERASARAAAAAERDAARKAAAEERATAAVERTADRFVVRDAARRERARQQQEQAAARQAARDAARAEKDAERNERAADRFIAREHDRQVKAAEQAAADAERSSARFDKAAVGLGVAAVAAIVGVYDRIEEKARAAAKAVNDARKSLRVEAALMNQPGVNNQVLLGATEFGVRTGLPSAEASEFVRQYEGSVPIGLQKFAATHDEAGAPRPGVRPEGISRAVADQLQVAAAVMAARQGGEAGTRGELAGLLGQFGPVGSAKEGLGQIEAIRVALTEGRGDDTPLTRQLLKAAGSMVREGGAVGSLPELAALIGVTSLSAGPEEAATRAEQLNRALKAGLAKFTKGKGTLMPQSAYLKGLGVKEGMGLEQIIDVVAPDVMKAQAAGRDADVYLAERGFRSMEERRAIIEIAPLRAQLKERLAKSREAGKGDRVEAENAAFLASPPGRQAVGEAMQGAAQLAIGLRGERLQSLEAEAEGTPEFARGDLSRMTAVGDFFRGISTGHVTNPLEAGRRARLRSAALAILKERALKAGVTERDIFREQVAAFGPRAAMAGEEGMTGALAGAAPLAAEQYVNRVEALIGARSPAALAADAAGVMADLKKSIDEENRLQAEANALMRAALPGAPGPGRPAVPATNPPRAAPAGVAGR